MTSGRRISPFLAFAAAAVPFAVLAARFWFLTDDAYISFRYARNLAEGHGLVFNPGSGEPPVEGYSNLGWVLGMAAVEGLGGSPGLWSRVLSVGAGLWLLGAFTRQLARGLGIGGWATVAGALFLGSLPPVALWSSGGLETMPAALALFGVYAALFSPGGEPRPRAASAFAACAVLLRADGVLWVGALTAAGALAGKLSRRPALSRAAALAAAAGVAACALQLGFRLWTYGDWLPNTVRAKISWTELESDQRAQLVRRGLYYVASFALAVPAVWLALAAAPRALLGPRRWALAPAAAVVAFATVYSVAVGGDFMAMGRFLVPALPFLGLLFAAGLEGLRPAAGALAGAAALALSLLAAYDLSPFPRSWRDHFHFRWNAPEGSVSEVEMWARMRERTRYMELLGRALAAYTGPEERATYGPVGAVGYYSGHTVYDVYGLTSRAMLAHSRLPDQLRSPGHDRTVDPAFLRSLEVTYLEAAVEPADSPPRPLPQGAPLRWEQHALDPARGFPAGHVLRLLRPGG